MTVIEKHDNRIEQQSTALQQALDAEQPVALMTGGDSFRIVDTENFLMYRRRYATTFSSTRLTAFTAFVLQTCSRHSVGCELFGAAENRQAHAFFNLGDPESPGHGDWKAELTLVPTPEFEAARCISDQPMSQRLLCDWVEEWRDSLVFVDGEGAALEPGKALGALRGLTVEASRTAEQQVAQFSEGRSAMEQIEARGSAGTLPARIIMKCAPYPDFQVREWPMRLSVVTGDEKIGFRLKPLAWETVLEHVEAEFVHMLTEQTAAAGADVVRVHTGTLSIS